MTSLKDLLVSRVRVKLLTIFFTNLDEIFYVRQLVRKAEEEINAIRRELAHLEKVGLLGKEVRANRLYYSLKKNFVLFDEILRIVTKTSGIGAQIISQKNKIGKVSYVMLAGRFAKGMACPPGKVDLLFVGEEIVLPQVAAIVRQFEGTLKREINYTAMSEKEYEFRKNRRDPFILDILRSSKIMLIGDEEDLIR